MTQRSSPASDPALTSGTSSTKYKLAFASIGVVFGDIGTSPLYAMREALHPVVSAGGDLRLAALGVVSLLLWALILVVGLKYLVFLMRADNRGEGGILSLVVLVETLLKKKGGVVLALGIIGAAFFFGCLLYTSDAADDLLCVDLGGRRIIKKTNTKQKNKKTQYNTAHKKQ